MVVHQSLSTAVMSSASYVCVFSLGLNHVLSACIKTKEILNANTTITGKNIAFTISPRSRFIIDDVSLSPIRLKVSLNTALRIANGDATIQNHRYATLRKSMYHSATNGAISMSAINALTKNKTVICAIPSLLVDWVKDPKSNIDVYIVINGHVIFLLCCTTLAIVRHFHVFFCRVSPANRAFS